MIYLIIFLIISISVSIGIFMHFKEKVNKLEVQKQAAIDNASNLEKYQGIVDIDNEIKSRGEHLGIIDCAANPFLSVI